MEFKWVYKSENARDAFAVRTEVFVDEQGFSLENELDSIDDVAWHLIGYSEEGMPVCAARLFCEQSGVWHAGRIAVKSCLRGKGIGRELVQALMEKAASLGAKRVELGAQYDKVPFYEKCGFISTGKQYLDEGYPHVQMACTVL